jgi:hypothetical protein
MRQYGSPLDNYLSPVPAAPAARIEHSLTNHFFSAKIFGTVVTSCIEAKRGVSEVSAKMRHVTKNILL